MKKMPSHLPPLPDGYVYAGQLGDYPVNKRLHGLAFEDGDSEWFGPTGWVGVEGDSASGSWHYAAPADSEIARLNGCGKPEDGRPQGGTVHVTVCDGGVQLHQSPDIIIPADVENELSTMELDPLIRAARFLGYRVEWSDEGVRGWARE